jgi:hypothetical protein
MHSSIIMPIRLWTQRLSISRGAARLPLSVDDSLRKVAAPFFVGASTLVIGRRVLAPCQARAGSPVSDSGLFA